MPTWPISLPTLPQRDSFRYEPQANVASFGTEVGPGKVRRRSTARLKLATGTFWMTSAQRDTFLDFFEDDLLDGSLPYDWTDPITGLTASWRFDPQSPYDIAALGPGMWRVSFNLMKLP